MARCSGVKRSGDPCKATVEPPQTYCWWHDPANAEQRSISASKAARSKTDVEIGSVKRTIKELAEDVVAGRVDKGRASVAFQGYGVFIRAVEAARKVKETEELEERLEVLERAQQQEGGSKRWGA